MDRGVAAIVSILTAITGLAIVAVLVSKKSNTGEVLTAFGNAYASAVREAVSPITSS